MTLNDAFSEAEEGKKIIEKIVTDYKKNYVVLIFPDKDEKVLLSALKYYKDFISDYECVYFLSFIDIDEFISATDIPYKQIKISAEEMDSVIRYLSIVTFPAIKIISINRPCHIKADRLIGKKDASLDDIVTRCLYGMKGAL